MIIIPHFPQNCKQTIISPFFLLLHRIYRGVILYREFLLAVSVSIDTYLAAAAYSGSGIRIPIFSSAIISFICAAVLGICIALSDFLSGFIDAEICRKIGIVVLILIGCITIAKSLVRSLARHIADSGELSLRMRGTPLIIKLYLDDTAADIDNSKILSVAEAALFAFAGSFDSAAVGLSSGFGDIHAFYAFIFTCITGLSAIFLGAVTGKKISSLHHDFSWAGGLILILLAFVI